jgi:hypothetical protein
MDSATLLARSAAQAVARSSQAYAAHISRITGQGTYAIAPSRSLTYEYGPVQFTGPDHFVEGDPCLLVFDEAQTPWVAANGASLSAINGNIASISASVVSLTDGLAAAVAPEPWHYVNDPATGLSTTFLNGWVNYDTARKARFYKHNGRCYLEGVICNGTVGAYAFILPAGYRPPLPSTDHYYPTVANGAFGSVIIDSAGGVLPASAGTATWAFLDSIDFRCA